MMPVQSAKPLLVTFSGLDGSGKSTQIANLVEYAQAHGMRVRQLAFWDDVVVGKRYREGFVHKVYGSERGVGEPGKPVQRRDKNVRKWYLSLARYGLYLLDAIHLCEVIARTRRERPDLIIMDRYIYDSLANLPLGKALTRPFVRLVQALAPRPDVAYLLDADVDAAYARKPEYPVTFMHQARKAYFTLAALLRNMTIVLPMPIDETKRAVIDAFDHAMRRPPHTVLDTAAA